MPQDMMLTLMSRRDVAQDITEFTFEASGASVLPAADAGGHVAIETPGGAVRQYSLVHPDQSPARYTVAVKRDKNGRGGSLAMHTLGVGDSVSVQAPANNFPLGAAPEYILIAGGIGVTPIYAMAQHLMASAAKLRMIYCARSAQDAAYVPELQALLGDRLTVHYDNGDLANLYDFWDDFAEPNKAHVYCCGPGPLMEEIKGISGHWPDDSIHFEDFAGIAAVREDDKPFKVSLRKTGQTITVPSDKSILEALRDAGIATISSCESGTCGTCKCGLIEGDVDHRDMVLMDDEKADQIMICVSRARAGELVLDL
ncbi:MAG: PDR/VanB family oxidoreductase [Tateyamaria sp.]|uniref:PDR/VanB family oxidoreductase n=2 Tax=Tateyamaria sp. TaxID=1929288 RepID=UPI0032917C2D